MKRYALRVALVFAAMLLFYSCEKELESDQLQPDLSLKSAHGHLKQTKTYSSEVAFKWMNMQLRQTIQYPVSFGGTPWHRYFAYGAIALYESVVPGMPGYRTLSGQLTDLPPMPDTQRGVAYYWPACANVALATLTRGFYTLASPANKAAIDSLENALNAEYQTLTDADELQRSIDFGKAVGDLVLAWSKTDRSDQANAPYTAPVGPGLWVPTPPGFGPPILPYWGNNRLMVSNSLRGTAPPPPPTYSEDPSSYFYQSAKEVYDVSQALTPDQKNLAIYYGGPGYGGAHYLSLIKQVLQKENRSLDFTSLVFAKTCIALIDANIGCFQVKYQYNQVRPITYIRNVLGYSSWNAALNTPPFPDYVSAHSVSAGALVGILESYFGKQYAFTDHTYDFRGWAPLAYNSLDDLANAISISRVYGGIHYNLSCLAGEEMGRKVARNINKMVEFKHDDGDHDHDGDHSHH
jgi:PAP2 superfamily